MRASVQDIAVLPSAQVEAWNALLAALAVPSPFLSHDFCRAVDAVRGGGRVLHVKEDGGTSGFLPFQIRSGRGLLGHAEKTGGHMSDMFGVVGRIRTPLDPDALLQAASLSSLRIDHAVEELCPFPFAEREETSGLRTRMDDYPTFLSELAQEDEQFVGMVAAGEKRLAKKFGPIRFEWHVADGAAELDRVIEVKRAQYLATGRPDGFAADWKRKLLHDLLRGKSALCRPVMSTLYAGENWVASHFGLTCGDTFHVWFPAYDPKFGRFGPGHMLFFKIFEQGAREGLRSFDFGEGEATYKARYRSKAYVLWKGVIRRQSVFGYSERVLQSVERRIRRRAARLREARSARASANKARGAGQDV